MVDKYEEIYQQLKKEAEEAVTSKSLDNCIEDFKNVVEDRVKLIHKEIDAAVAQILDAGELAFKDSDNFNISIDTPQINELLTFNSRVATLTKYMNDLVKLGSNKSKVVESLASYNCNEYELFKINKEGLLEFKALNRVKILGSGKVDADLGWKKDQNQPNMSKVETSDEKVLKVMGTGCYNYYMTDKEVIDTNLYAEFESTVTQNDTYFYFGIANETTVPSSNCMCCNPSSVIYMWHDGNLSQYGSKQAEQKLEFKSKGGKPTILRVKIMGSDKEAYFQIDDKDEVGPYKLVGSKWRITFGSCNTSSGQIKIVNSYFI